MLLFLDSIVCAYIQRLQLARLYRPIFGGCLSLLFFRTYIDCFTKDIQLAMAKSKSKKVKDVEATTQLVFKPISKKYKPLPKFNGKCKDC